MVKVLGNFLASQKQRFWGVWSHSRSLPYPMIQMWAKDSSVGRFPYPMIQMWAKDSSVGRFIDFRESWR
ncbi:hypothetical protein CDB3_29215 [Bacillus sp. CDB3]|nr:hypothetical protein CDB3_29215 [Bacillus sp. CDB3]